MQPDSSHGMSRPLPRKLSLGHGWPPDAPVQFARNLIAPQVPFNIISVYDDLQDGIAAGGRRGGTVSGQ
jgi:hypothetical protein